MSELPQRGRDTVPTRRARGDGSSRSGVVPPIAILTQGWVIVAAAAAIGVVYLARSPQPTPVEQIALQEPAGLVQSLWLESNGAFRVATRLDGTIRPWRADAGSGRAEPCGSALAGRVAAFSPDGMTLAVGGDSTLALLETTSDAPWQTVRTEAGLTSALAFSHDGATLAVAGEQGVTLWNTAPDARRAERKLQPVPREVTRMAFAPDGQTLATGDQGGFVRLWDVKSGRERVAFRAQSFHVSSLSFSSDSRVLATACYAEQTARLWDVATGRGLTSLSAHPGVVRTVAFAPGGGIVATAGSDGTVRLWDATTGRLRVSLRYDGIGIDVIAFSPDGRLLAGGGYDPAVWLWNLSGISASPSAEAAEPDPLPPPPAPRRLVVEDPRSST